MYHLGAEEEKCYVLTFQQLYAALNNSLAIIWPLQFVLLELVLSDILLYVSYFSYAHTTRKDSSRAP